jgi:hypothetical protein
MRCYEFLSILFHAGNVNLKKRRNRKKRFYPALFISYRHEMFKYQKTQATADKFDAGNSELFSNQI